MVLTGLETVLARHPERFRIVPATDATQREEDRPEVVLYDVLALQAGDDELTLLLGRTTAKVIAVGRDLRPDLGHRALAAGVNGLLSLGVGEEELVETVASVGAGEADRTRARPTSAPVAGTGAAFGLSARETEVLVLIAQGLTNSQIAEKLFLSVNSVKTYVRNAYGKIGALNRSQAVGWVVRHGVEAHSATR